MVDMKRRKTSHSTGQARADVTPHTEPLDPDNISELRFRLLNAGLPGGNCVPAVHALFSGRFGNASDGIPVLDHLQPSYDFLSGDIAYCCELTASSVPQPISLLPHKLFASYRSVGYEQERARFIQSVLFTEAECLQITEVTAGQSQNVEWFRQRMGSLTASRFGRILKFCAGGRGKVERLVKDVQDYESRSMTCIRTTNVPALKWGMKCEAVARKSYKCLLESQHKGVEVLQTGLHVCCSEPFLRASPDGIVSCSCHGERRILEIKCPWSARDLDPVEAIETGVITYIGSENNAYTLKPGDSRGYYEQVQGTMAITGIRKCDFVMWTTRGMLKFEVTYDRVFWESVAKPQLTQFFHNCVVTEILTERVWHALPLFDYSAYSDSSTDTADDDDDAECEQDLPVEPTDDYMGFDCYEDIIDFVDADFVLLDACDFADEEIIA